MEEQSPDAQPGGRRAPRARTPKTDFTPPVVDPAEQPATSGKRAAGKQSASPPARPRRPPSTIAPVLFQPPTAPSQSATPPAEPSAQEFVPEKTPTRKAAPKKAAAKKAAPKKAAAKKTASRKAAAEAQTTIAPAVEQLTGPAVEPTSEPTSQTGGQPITPAAGPHQTLARLVSRPDYAPEVLALAAVDTIGPAAEQWAARTRHEYPAATDDALARLAVRRFVRLGGLGAAASTSAGLLAPVVELAAVGWTEAALVLHVAAAHRLDPTDPVRAVELLVLTRIHPDDESARAAVERANRPVPESGDIAVRLVDAAQRVVQTVAGPAGLSGGWAVVRAAARLLPGARALAASAGDMLLLERLAARATTRYRQAGTATGGPAPDAGTGTPAVTTS